MWSRNYLEQLAQIARLEESIRESKNRLQPVVKLQYHEPTQAEWESAYTAKTGKNPPIPVGSRLHWVNPGTRVCREYSVVNDLDGGKNSSGTVHQFTNPYTRNSSLFRYLGGFHSELHMMGTDNRVLIRLRNNHNVAASNLSSNPSVLGTDWGTWSERGLTAVFILFEIQTPTTDGDLDIKFVLNDPLYGIANLALDFNHVHANHPVGTEWLRAIWTEETTGGITIPSGAISGDAWLPVGGAATVSATTPTFGLFILPVPLLISATDSDSNVKSHPPRTDHRGALGYVWSGTVGGPRFCFINVTRRGTDYKDITPFFDLNHSSDNAESEVWAYGLFTGEASLPAELREKYLISNAGLRSGA